MSDAVVNGLAGAGGGIVAVLLTYPLQAVSQIFFSFNNFVCIWKHLKNNEVANLIPIVSASHCTINETEKECRIINYNYFFNLSSHVAILGALTPC